jgi:hypothetical protein
MGSLVVAVGSLVWLVGSLNCWVSYHDRRGCC